MDKNMELFIVTLLLVTWNIDGSEGQIMSLPPVNRAVRAGSDMMWSCAAPDDITLTGTWYEFVTAGSGQIISLNDQIQHPNPDHYKVNMKTENGLQHFDLDIYGCTSADAGRYYFGPLSPTSQSNAFLIILDSELNCLDNRPVEVEEGDMITMQCQVGYSGLWGPITEWTDMSGGPVEGVIDESIPGNILYTYNIVVDPDDNGLTIDCSLMFESPPGGVIPDNGTDFWYSSLAPDYTDSCQFDTLEVYYNPRDIVISTDPDHGDGEVILSHGDNIKCEANGNPPVQYRWVDLDTGDLTNTDTMDVTAEMEGDRNYQCVTWNIIKGEERHITHEFSFKVIGAVIPGNPMMFIALSNTTSRSVTLQWQSSGFDGGYPPLTYILEYKTASDSDYIEFDSNISENNIIVVTVGEEENLRLDPAQQYDFRVRARNSHPDEAKQYSNYVMASAKTKAMPKVELGEITVSQTTMKVTWSYQQGSRNRREEATSGHEVGVAIEYKKQSESVYKRHPETGSVDAAEKQLQVEGQFDVKSAYDINFLVFEEDLGIESLAEIHKTGPESRLHGGVVAAIIISILLIIGVIMGVITPLVIQLYRQSNTKLDTQKQNNSEINNSGLNHENSQYEEIEVQSGAQSNQDNITAMETGEISSSVPPVVYENIKQKNRSKPNQESLTAMTAAEIPSPDPHVVYQNVRQRDLSNEPNDNNPYESVPPYVPPPEKVYTGLQISGNN